MFGLFIIWFPFIVLIFGSVLPRRQLQHLFCGAVQDAVVIGLDHFNLPPVGSDENVIVYRAHVKCEGALAVLIKSVGSRSARREVEYETIYAHTLTVAKGTVSVPSPLKSMPSKTAIG